VSARAWTGTTRREALKGMAIAGGGAIAGTGIPILIEAPEAFGKSGSDGDVLERSIRLEQDAIVAYDAAAQRGLVRGSLERTVTLFRDQQREHVDALGNALEKLGGSVPGPPSAARVRGLGNAKAEEDFLRLAIELEDAIVKGYIDALRKLKDEALLTTCAQMMANAGQHLVVLRQALGADPIPGAFEAGTGD
jgi:rubrerythrin